MESEPIPMVLPCPKCGALHIDAPEPDAGWNNPPHTSHQCHFCTTDDKPTVWRPADVPTTGVAQTETKGSRDNWNGELASDELADYKSTFDLRWKADRRATEKWREGHPERSLTMPDHVDLVLWLESQLTTALERVREYEQFFADLEDANVRDGYIERNRNGSWRATRYLGWIATDNLPTALEAFQALSQVDGRE